MAKAALLDVLRQTIGKYVKNLDPESLSVAVWSGKIELNSLELDVESINSMLDKKAEEAPNLAMPFKVISGRFESFQVDVPWVHISSQSVVLRAKGLSVVVEPLDRKSSQFSDDDDTIEHDTVVDMKRGAKQRELREHQIDESNTYRLQTYALKRIALAADKESGDDGDTSTFASRLVQRIGENIQIEISDVHVSLRNEDGSAGVVLESLKLMTTDQQGRFIYVDRTAADHRNSSLSDVDMSFQYRMLQIEGFGVYLDEDEFVNARKSLRSISEDGISDNNSVYSRRSLGHSYVLAPLSFQTMLRIADDASSANTAKYELKSSLSVLSFVLRRSQVDIVRKVANIMSPPNAMTPLFPEYRPVVLVKGHAKEWWRYARRCIGRMSGKRLWIEFFEAYKKRKKYIPLFKRHSHHKDCSWVKPLNKDELNDLISIEQDRCVSVEGLMAWRNIADAQIDKEKEKRENTEQETSAPSVFSYIFGSRATTSPDGDETKTDEKPAVVLSVDEMKELEDISKLNIAGLTKDGLYYDVNFVLDAMKIDLVGYDLNHLALLDMGKVTIDFDANSDGAFTSSFQLYDLQIFDRTTPNSLFPSVLKKIESGSDDKTSRALKLDLSKSSSGDQSLVIKLAEFQLVASKLMAEELQLFFQDSSNKSTGTKMKSNPVLRKSVSGSVDLFYDAKEGDSLPPSSQVPRQVDDEIRVHNSPEVKEILSNKLVEVWKKKSLGEVSWTVDIDVKAPIVLIPEACNSLEANVMVFDLGSVKVQYGRGYPSDSLQQWFDEYPRESLNNEKFETGTISVNDLTFSVQKASFWHSTYPYDAKECAIIDPIGVEIDFAVEDIGPDFEPRSCFLGVIPTISLRLSSAQGSQILEVITSWTDIFIGQGEDSYPREEPMPISSPLEHDSGNTHSEQSNSTPSMQGMSAQQYGSTSSVEESFPMVYFRIGLQRLSVIVMEKEKKQLEAHLVSVYASLLRSSDKSSVARLTMGWFWVLDWIESSYARKQRLLIHSNLPRSAESFAARNEYNVIEELTKQGVFDRHYSGSTELADVSYTTLSGGSTSSIGEDIIKYQNLENCINTDQIDCILDAKFRSLVVHWNPHAIKEITALSSRFLEVFDPEDKAGTLILNEVKSPTHSVAQSSKKPSHNKEDIETSDSLLILAEMESLGVVLNSARDDLPLFTFTVSGTRVSIVPRNAGQEISLSLGDLRVATPENSGDTLQDYRTLLGLEHGSSGSLLTVKYCEGREAIETLNLQMPELKHFEAVAVVELSPMRFCYIQSQVLTLVNYVTDGILGALTAQAAISAAEAAKDFANSVSGHYFFSIRATSFEAIIPEAAYRDEHMRLKTASIDVDYYMYSDARGSEIEAALSDLMVQGNLKKNLQEFPIRLAVDVKMPMIGVGSLDEQAMRVNSEISKAKFVLTKDQYSQIMNTLEKNFSETALFLRENEVSGQMITSAKETHSGVQLDESIQRIYFALDIKEVSLVLNGRDRTDPLIRLTATETTISMDLIPDLEKFSVKALLQDLVCEDCRLVARTRQSRFLIDRSRLMDETENKDIFHVKYCQEGQMTNIDLTLGSPQVVLIPDLISEVLLFVDDAESEQQNTNAPSEVLDERETSLLNEQVVQLDAIDGEETIEASLRSSNTSVTKISAQTGTCRFVLVDLGSQPKENSDNISYAEKADSRPQLTETVVLQGIFTAALSMESNLESGQMQAANFQVNSDAMEIFTAFGREMKSPLQILEPASASIHGSSKTTVAGDTELEVRAAALTPIAFSFSIHNAALLMAIIDSVNDSFKSLGEKETAELGKDQYLLTEKEQERIEELATALEQMGNLESFGIAEGDSSLANSRTPSVRMLDVDTPAKTRVQIKVTMPQARICFINDLQGMDEALFRISVTNFVAGGTLTSPTTLFDFHCNTAILADYFDSSMNLWCRLLIKPWEITMKASRGPSNRFKSKRLSSTFDLESFPCWISFSEQFLVSLASAARMWSIYSAATNGPLDESPEQKKRTAARNLNLITSFPNAISNYSGIGVSFSLKSGSIKDRSCPTEFTQYFRFDPPKGSGHGGTRVYGQDVEVPKIVEVVAEGNLISVNMDLQLGLPPCAHEIGDKLVLYTRVVKEGKTTVLHLRSHIEVINRTLIPFNIEYLHDEEACVIGRCKAKNSKRESLTTISSTDGVVSKRASNFGIPTPLLANFQKGWQKFGQGKLTLRLLPLTSDIDKSGNRIELLGEVVIDVSLQELRRAPYEQIKSKVEVTCSRKEYLERGVHPLTLNVILTMSLLGGEHVVIDASLEPRCIIENKMPLAMKIRTPMPQTFSTCQKEASGIDNETIYCVCPNERVEVFTPGPSIAISTCTRDNPIAGLDLGWLDGGWVDLPLIQEFRLQDPLVGMLPLENKSSVATDRVETTRAPGAEFFIVEGKERLATIADIGAKKQGKITPNLPLQSKNLTGSRRNDDVYEPLLFILTVCNYGVDHTGCVLFEQASRNEKKSRQSGRNQRKIEIQRQRSSSLLDELSENRNASPSKSSLRLRGRSAFPLGAFSSPVHRRRISLLPNTHCPVRLLQMTIEGAEGFRRTMPFMIEHLPIGDGGAATVPIVWENQMQTGLYAYRRLVNEHQSEIHVIPEFIVFNGSENIILVKEEMMPEMIIESGETGQLRATARPKGLQISINFIDLECATGPVSVAKLGLKVAIVKSNEGRAVGSVYIQTVIDTLGDSRLVIKVGKVRFGSNILSPVVKGKGLFDGDFCRFRIRWTELQLVLNEVVQREHVSWDVKTLKTHRNKSPTISADVSPKGGNVRNRASTKNLLKQEPQNQSDGRKSQIMKQPIMAMIFSRFTVDFQRVFKDGENSRRDSSDGSSSQRSQISVIVHNIQIKDLTPNSHYPMVFDCTSDKSVFDLCIRIRGALSADMVKVDLFDLNLAHEHGKSEKMTLTTSEEYLWRILDLVNRILDASGEVSGFTIKYENDENDNYVIKIEDSSGNSHSKVAVKNQYTAPAADVLYDIALARVSPFTIVVSFRRSPELARYKKAQINGPGAAVTNYFTRKLKFTIDKAELNFGRYEDRTLKGPLDRLIEALSTVYVGRMKFKVVSLLSAASLQDWRFLAARDDGDDEYIEGDILRASGNLAGKSAGLVVKTVGKGVGGAVLGVTSLVGDGIENGTSKIGARRFGSGVNSVVTGVGHGVNSTVSGVGTGASKFLQGAGQGVGHVIGGVSGGALQIGKGIGKGIATGDGRAFVEGISKGAQSIGGGIAQGAESTVMGTADGILSAGKGIFSGFKSVGQGVGGAIRGKKPSQFQRKKKGEEKK